MNKTDALIIGAGPTGLFTAHQLKLIGLDCEILSTLISSFIKSLNKFITCCFSVIVGFSLTFTLASTIGFLVVCFLHHQLQY